MTKKKSKAYCNDKSYTYKINNNFFDSLSHNSGKYMRDTGDVMAFDPDSLKLN